MTLIDLNPVEIYLIIRCLQHLKKTIDESQIPTKNEFDRDKLDIRSKEIQSVIYKLEKSLQAK